ncbi:MAG TPA: pirin family protein [Burkholderiaceae bacterium]|nr:pirin family protein [Burkholderiaceae bacterium]
MIEVRRSEERGRANHGWLDSRFSFSFAEYWDPKHMGFGPLRVINDDRIAPGTGFGMHPHRDMEIITYVLEGELAHRDSMGNGSVIRAGDVQRMSAGTGIRHSEFSHSKDAVTHLLQIWIEPNQTGVEPSYEEKRFGDEQKRGRLRLIVSPDGAEGSVRIHQDARVYAGLLDGDEQARLALSPNRLTYVHVARGAVEANGVALGTGDALKLANVSELIVNRGESAEVLVFDLPATH